MHQNAMPRRDGFSLVELAIVLVIIGLLVGAVIGGTALLKQSQLQTVIADYSKYSAAVAQFEKQYGSLPGDMIDATNFWGDDNAACADAGVVNGTPGTCNGNGDGLIVTTNEPFRAWQHLQLAGVVDGVYSGVTGGGGAAHAVLGTNVPRSRITNAGWSIWNNTSVVGNADWYAKDLSNLLMFGAPVTNGLTQGPVITPQEAFQIDKKIDDSLPASGRVVALKAGTSTTPGCTTSAVDASAAYALSSSATACNLNMSLTTK